MGTHPTKKNQSQCSWFLIWLIVILSSYNYSLDTVLSKRTFPPTERLNLTPSCVERNVTFTQAVQMGNNQNCIFKNFRILFLFYFYFIGRHFAVIIHFCILYSINVSMTELFTLDIKIKFLYNPTLGVNVQFLDLNLLTTSTCLVWTCTRRSVIQLHAVHQIHQVHDPIGLHGTFVWGNINNEYSINTKGRGVTRLTRLTKYPTKNIVVKTTLISYLRHGYD